MKQLPEPGTYLSTGWLVHSTEVYINKNNHYAVIKLIAAETINKPSFREKYIDGWFKRMAWK